MRRRGCWGCEGRGESDGTYLHSVEVEIDETDTSLELSIDLPLPDMIIRTI
jgi:hypothetical protein